MIWQEVIAWGVIGLGSVVAVGACGAPDEQDEDASVEEIGADEAALISRRFCGGIAGIACPAGLRCVDNPDDGCDPRVGADCGGVCVPRRGPPPGGGGECRRRDPAKRYIVSDPDRCAAVRFACNEGEAPFFDDCGCGCQRGEPCGDAVCGAGTYCCNASCGICAPEGGFCTQQVCPPEQ